MPDTRGDVGGGSTSAMTARATNPALDPESDRDMAAAPPPATTPLTTATPAVATANTVVVMTGRRTWIIGESIGLSQGYTFVPGAPIEVTPGDAKLLLSREWDGRSFSVPG